MAYIHVNRHDGTPRVACLQVFQQNTQKSECVYRRSPIGRPNNNLRVDMASDANWLSPSLLHVNNLCPDQDKHYSRQTFVVFWFENENDILRFFS